MKGELPKYMFAPLLKADLLVMIFPLLMIIATQTHTMLTNKTGLMMFEDNDEDGGVIMVDRMNLTFKVSKMSLDDGFDASSIAGKNFSYEEKIELMKKLPCQPTESVLSKRKNRIGDREQCSLEKDSLLSAMFTVYKQIVTW